MKQCKLEGFILCVLYCTVHRDSLLFRTLAQGMLNNTSCKRTTGFVVAGGVFLSYCNGQLIKLIWF